MSALAPTLEAFFTQRLVAQRDASPRTISAYRDAWRLLLIFARNRVGKTPSQLDFADLDAGLVSAFLTSLEAERGNSASTRNSRLTAIRSLFRYAAPLHPEHAGLIMRVLAIPSKRHDQTMICFLNPDEVDALLVAPRLRHLARPTGPRPPRPGYPNRTTGVRADQPHHQRHPPGHRGKRALLRQG
jgi:site-specific recombinase XerD